jgi:beta-glucanase (GH16 family)
MPSEPLAPSLTLVMQVINDNGGTAVPADWTLTAVGYNAASPAAGTYDLTASGPAGYTQTSLTCSNSGDTEVTSVTLSAGQSVTCTFVNDDDAINVNIDNPTLTVADNLPVTGTSGLELVWSDEFNAEKLDPEVWLFERGDGSQYGISGWGNNELQYYLEDSAQLENGLLVITARRQSVGGMQYTSARINTRDRFAFRYGRIEASIRLPGGQGIWPAFWMLPQDNAYGGWAASGEIDIVEAINLGASGGNTVYGTIHFGGEWPDQDSRGESYPVPEDAAQVFHTYALEWDETELRWYVNDQLYAVQSATWSSTGGAFPAPFDQPFYILFNTAVGGNWPGSPDESTVLPVTMEVDWVRVYSGSL